MRPIDPPGWLSRNMSLVTDFLCMRSLKMALDIISCNMYISAKVFGINFISNLYDYAASWYQLEWLLHVVGLVV